MNIQSTIIESESLGHLHVLEVGEGPIVGVSADAIGGSVLSDDTFGIARTTAGLLEGRVISFDRPGTGHSSLPEDASLRRDLLKHGYIGVSSVVNEALRQRYGIELERATYIGHSLGGYAAALAGFEIGAKEVITLDSGAWSRANMFMACLGYAVRTYQEARNGTKGYPLTDIERAELQEAKQTVQAPAHKGGNFKEGVLPIYEMRDIFEQARPGAMSAMKQALYQGRVERVKIGFCDQTFNLNNERRAAINQVVHEFGHNPSPIGVVIGGALGNFHRESAFPSAVSYMLLNDTDGMQDKL